MNKCMICFCKIRDDEKCFNCKYNICTHCSNRGWCSKRCIYTYYDIRSINGYEFLARHTCNDSSYHPIYVDQLTKHRTIMYVNAKTKNFSYFILKEFLIKDIAKIVSSYY